MLIICLLLCSIVASAQKYPERTDIRSGNKEYQNGNFSEAEVKYLRALEKAPGSFEGGFNLTNSLYKQERFEDASKLASEAQASAKTPDQAAMLYYNEGNTLFKQRKLEEAIAAYKNSLRINPKDEEAKFNLAYAKKLLEKDKNNGSGGGGGDNQKDPQQQPPQKEQNQDQQGDGGDKQEQPNQPDKQDNGQPKDKNQQPQPQGGINKDEAEQMLEAMQGSEDNTKQKVDAQKVKSTANTGKNW